VQPFKDDSVGLVVAYDDGFSHIHTTYNAIWAGVDLDNFEFYCTHSTSNNKGVSFTDRAVSFQKVWLQVDIEEVSLQVFNGVVDGENVNSLSVLDVSAGMYADNITETDAQVVTDDTVQSDF
jgi:hypothetical protein